LQHKSLLLFTGKKVIVAKIKLCGKVIDDHGIRPPNTVAVDIIPPVVYFCKRESEKSSACRYSAG
jgi:hypothetical protein